MSVQRPAFAAVSTDWQDAAACVGQPITDYYPLTGAIPTRVRELCATCPVQRECLDYALTTEAGLADDHRFGVWGGLTAKERMARAG